jgi:hypothetical protein
MDPEFGIRIARRHALKVSLGIAAGGACTGFVVRGDDAAPVAGKGFEPLGFDAFTSLWKELVKEFIASGGIDADYAARLASLLARRDAGFALPDYKKRNESADFVAGPCWFDVGMAIIRFEMKPGAVLQAHDHPPQIVVTSGIDGTATFRHFESVDAKLAHDSRETFLIRETKRGVLEAGRTTSLTRQNDWIHTFEAGKNGATIADFTATLTKEQDDWSYAEIAAEPANDVGHFTAKWVGKKR